MTANALGRGAGFADYPVGPDATFYGREVGEFLLPYEAVAGAAEPDQAMMEFLDSTYAAAAELGGWDRRALETDPHRWDQGRR